MTDYERDLKALKSCIKLKGVIMSNDRGKTWYIYRQDYLTHANNEYQQFHFAQAVSLVGLPLKTDFESLKEPKRKQSDLMTDEMLCRFRVHDQLIYKIGVILNAIGFDELQLDLPVNQQTPPFIDEEKRPYEDKGRKYDIKGIFNREYLIIEVHDKGDLIKSLVKLSELKFARKGLVLVNTEDEHKLKRELKRRLFRDLLYELKLFYKDEIEELYDQYKKAPLTEDYIQMCIKSIFERPPYIERILE